MTSDEWNNIEPRLSPDGKYVLFLSYPGTLKVIPEKSDMGWTHRLRQPVNPQIAVG